LEERALDLKRLKPDSIEDFRRYISNELEERALDLKRLKPNSIEDVDTGIATAMIDE
jgi:hypothetical protein